MRIKVEDIVNPENIQRIMASLPEEFLYKEADSYVRRFIRRVSGFFFDRAESAEKVFYKILGRGKEVGSLLTERNSKYTKSDIT